MIRLDKLLLFAFASFSTAVTAQEVSVDAAKSHVLEFLSNKTSGPMRAKGQQVSNDLELAYTSKSEAKTCFYVFNLGNDNGFVIAGGDESARQILGYCDHGSFDYDTANPAFKWWLGQYEEQIAHAEVPSASPRKAKASAEERSSIGPLISTSWSQRDPYNCEIPVYDSKGTPYLTGCAATAMAQIMNYWKYPDFGTGSNSFSRDGFEFSADFEHTLYDWDNMLDTYLYDEESGDPLFSSEEAKAVGTLMYHAGVAANMWYGTEESYAKPEEYIPAFVNYFEYDGSIRAENRIVYTDEAWSDLVYSELNARRPIFYTGGGHAFVCDGYDSANDEFHFNWGWGGKHDGYYSLSGSNYSNFLQHSRSTIYINVMPADHEPDTEFLHMGQADDHLSVQIGDKKYYVPEEESGEVSYDENCEYNLNEEGYLDCYLYSNIRNLCCFTDDFDFGVKAYDADCDFTYYTLSQSNQHLDLLSNTGEIGLQFYPYDWVMGTYILTPVFRVHGQTSDSDWKEIELLPDQIIPTITLKDVISKQGSVLVFTEQPWGDNDNNFYSGNSVVHFTVGIMGYGDLSDQKIYYYMDSSFNGIHVTDVGLGFFSIYLPSSLHKGYAYTLYFFRDEECEHPFNYPSLTFTYRDKLTVDYGVSPAGYGTLILPFNAELPEGMTIYSCPSVDENGVLTLVEESSIERNKPYIVKATYGENYHFEGPEAIDDDKPSFQEGILVGAVANNVVLQKNTDYILQVQEGKAAFYKYTGTKADEPSENDSKGNRLAKQFRAFLRLPEGSSNAPKFNLPGFDEDETESISTLRSAGTMPTGIYSIDGKRQNEFQKGLNILLFEDGTAQKVFVK